MDVKAVITLMDTLTHPSSAEGTARRAEGGGGGLRWAKGRVRRTEED